MVGIGNRETSSRRFRHIGTFILFICLMVSMFKCGMLELDRMRSFKTHLFKTRHTIQTVQSDISRVKQIVRELGFENSSSNSRDPRNEYGIGIAMTNIEMKMNAIAQRFEAMEEFNRIRLGPSFLLPNNDPIEVGVRPGRKSGVEIMYNGIKMDQKLNAFQFKETGLFRVIVQVNSVETPDYAEKSLSTGLRIYLGNPALQPFPLLECVTACAYPNTCFTQMIWFFSSGDQIMLERFYKNKLSVIETESKSPGRIFVGVNLLSTGTKS